MPRKDRPRWRRGRRPYRTPRLVDYGSIPARTLGSMVAGSFFDAMYMTLAKKP
jgi:hypothetical protein